MTPNKKTVTLQWCLCVFTSFLHCEWVWCVVVFGVFGRESCVSWSVVCVIMWCKVASVGGVRLRACRLGSAAVQVWKCAGGERCVDLETQKEGKEINSKR